MTRDEEVKTAFAEFHQVLFDKLLNALIAKVDARARAEEREACARLCEDDSNMWVDHHECAAAIRKRGEQ
jgi:hypothetical protein